MGIVNSTARAAVLLLLVACSNEEPAVVGGLGEEPNPAQPTSHYTALNLEDCEVLKVWEESGGQALRCQGWQGTPLFITEGDVRFDVDVGVSNDQWTSTVPPNWLGDTVEWRLQGDELVAVIVRYILSDPLGARGPHQLAVIKPGTESSSGCLVGWVAADAEPDMNSAARRMADVEAGKFNCAAEPLQWP